MMPNPSQFYPIRIITAIGGSTQSAREAIKIDPDYEDAHVMAGIMISSILALANEKTNQLLFSP